MSIKNVNVLKNQLNIYLIPSLVYYPDGCTIFDSSYLIYLLYIRMYTFVFQTIK